MVHEKRCAFLTMEDTAGWSIDADLAFEPMADRGWRCEWLSWRKPTSDWGVWDAVYPAATWDYPEAPEQFLSVLEDIDRSTAILVNPIELLRWNIPKTYLHDLETRGARIVPSRWYERYSVCDLEADARAFATRRVIVKPVISTNANDTFLTELPLSPEAGRRLAHVFADRPFVVQPFLDRIQVDGEFSLFYIDGTYSHAICKVPKARDFRVQEEHGAAILSVQPDDELRRTADRVMSLVRPEPLYARCDFVASDEGYCVMELELIEPSLYLRMDDAAPGRFAAAFDRYITSLSKGGPT